MIETILGKIHRKNRKVEVTVGQNLYWYLDDLPWCLLCDGASTMPDKESDLFFFFYAQLFYHSDVTYMNLFNMNSDLLHVRLGLGS